MFVDLIETGAGDWPANLFCGVSSEDKLFVLDQPDD